MQQNTLQLLVGQNKYIYKVQLQLQIQLHMVEYNYIIHKAQLLVASHQLMISFTFSFGCIKLGYQSSSVLTVFCIWIICIWSKDTQRSQNLETTIAPKFKVQNRPKIAQKNRQNGTIFRMPSPKISTNQKIVPTDQHYQHVFATLLHILFTPPEEKIKRP